jgi:spore maturation protein CgeB
MKNITIIGKNNEDSLAWHINYTLNKLDYNSSIVEPKGGFENKFLNETQRLYLGKIFKSYEDYVYKKLLNEIKEKNPSLIIVILRSIPPYVIKELKKTLSTKIIFWTGDAFINLERGYALISEYDAWFVKDTYMYDFMKNKLSLNVYCIPECFNPDFISEIDANQFGTLHDITIAGTLYPYRAKILEHFINKGFNISIFGSLPKWMDKKWKKIHTNKYITLKEKNNIFFKSKINLNTLHYGEVNAGNCRLFEIAGAGGFQICDRKEIINEYFEEDKEIVFFDNLDDLEKKMNYYLKNPEIAMQIGKASQVKALKHHTYKNRIDKIFKIIGFNN